MDYIYRSTKRLKGNPNFNFHSKCEKSSLINMSFADDFLLFVRGDTMSIDLMMKVFNNFFNYIGMYVNPNKCNIYFGNIENDIKQEIRHATEFSEGSIPSRYLGIPFSSKRLSIGHCLILVERIVKRIKHWSAKILNFARRLQLINNVLFSTTNYWLQCLPLPQTVIKKVEVACRSFLWSSSDMIT
ncbi:unnamed protein product [Lathyrus oleraceus]